MRTLAVFGNTGAGKSELLNAWLQEPLFHVSRRADACTQLTAAQERVVGEIIRRGIDTPGLGDSGGLDGQHLQQLAQFFKSLEHGVNAFAVVINSQAPRFDQSTQKMLKIANAFFDVPGFWNHVCIVFTRVYPGEEEDCDRDELSREYRGKIIDLIRDCMRQRERVLERDPTLPVFFVNSPKWQTQKKTIAQLEVMHRFVTGLPPLSTPGVVARDPKYLLVTTDTDTTSIEVSRVEVARKDCEKVQAEVAALMSASMGGGTDPGAGVEGESKTGAIVGGSLGGGGFLGAGVGVGVGVAVAGTSAGASAATGAEVGALAGMAAGPIGAAIGAGVGVVVGAVVGGIVFGVRRETIVAFKVTIHHTEKKHITMLDYEGNTYFDHQDREWNEVKLVPVE
jgi:hypothetical protein